MSWGMGRWGWRHEKDEIPAVNTSLKIRPVKCNTIFWFGSWNRKKKKKNLYSGKKLVKCE